MPEEKRKGLHLAGQSQQRKAGAIPKEDSTKLNLKAKARTAVLDDDEDEDEDDEILTEEDAASGGKSKWLYIVIGVVVVVVVILAFLLFGGKKKPPEDVTPPTSVQQGQNVPTTPVQPEGPTTPEGVGTQDFTGDTTMSNSDVLTDPDKYIEDIYGLTTRVDYTVNSISNVADFVSYEKHRGTWGGGLELYWLDVTYKNNHYVVQVPFKYYKELDDIGIVPVKMEVLSIQGTGADEKLTVISYMCLDEQTLKEVLKSQSKGK